MRSKVYPNETHLARKSDESPFLRELFNLFVSNPAQWASASVLKHSTR